MTFIPPNANMIYSDYQASLTDGSEIDSGWLDMAGVDKVQFSGRASAAGMTMTIDSRSDPSQTALSTPVTYSDGSFYLFNIICRQRYMRFHWANNTGSTVTEASMEIKQTFGGSDKLSVFPLGVEPSDFSQAALVRAVNTGVQPDGDYVNIPADGAAFATTSTLGSGATYTSSWVDTDGWKEIELVLDSDVASADEGIVIQFTDDTGAGTPSVRREIYYTFSDTDVANGALTVRLGTCLDGFRISYTNGSSAQSSFYLEATLKTTPASGSSVSLESEVAGETIAAVNRSVIVGRQPDGDYVNSPADGSAFATTSTLSGGGSYTSSWVDTDGWKEIEFVVASDVASADGGVQVQFTDDTGAGTPTVRKTLDYSFTDADVVNGTLTVKLGTLLDGFRIVYTNGSSAQSSFYLEATLKTAPASATALSLESEIDSSTVAAINRSIIVGQQPDGDYVNTPADGAAFSNTSTLSGGATYTSDWTDSDGWKTVEIVVATDVVSADDGIEIQYTDDVQAGTPTVRVSEFYTFTTSDVADGSLVIKLGTLLDGFRVVYTNGPSAQSSFYIEATLRTAPTGATELSLESAVDPSTVAGINRSVLVGKDFTGTYQNVSVTETSALLTGDFLLEVARGNVAGYSIVSKFGNNDDIDTDSDPEDVWGGSGLYTGQPAHSASAETVDIQSTDTDDTAAGSGARTVEIQGLDENWEEQTEVLTLNGTTAVTSTGLWHRVFRAKVLTAGSQGENDGTITINHTTTTGNVFISIPPTINQSLLAAYTVPVDKTAILQGMTITLVRANGSNGSGVATLRAREEDGVYNTKGYYNISNALPANPDFKVPIIFEEKTDILIRVEEVSDSNSLISAFFDLLLIDNVIQDGS